MNAQVLAIANQKGGVGKTTTAVTLASAFSKLGKQVLVIDLDPHACATIHLAYFSENISCTAYDLFSAANDDDISWERLIQTNNVHGFDVVAGSVKLSDMESDLKGRPGKGLILKRRLKIIRQSYDYILLDCPPQVGVILVNALVASDLLVIPTQTDFLALHGLKLIFETIRMLNKALDTKIKYRALATMYDQRASACRRVLHLLQNNLKEKLFEAVIHVDTNFREASAEGRVILDLTPESRGSIEYMNLAKEIIHGQNA